MSDTRSADARREFVAAQLATLGPFDFLVVGVPIAPYDAVKIERGESGGLTVDVGARAVDVPFSDGQIKALTTLGFEETGTSWSTIKPPADVDDAVALVERALVEVLAVADGTPLDIRHGSGREDHEAGLKLAEMRARIEPVLASMLDGKPAPQDGDGDYIVDLGPTRVFVAPRVLPGRPAIIRVFAITNGGLNLTSELGLFLARVNFSLMFGRFSIDTDHQAVWFDETLLGDATTDDELRFIVDMVATTANEWDDKIAQMFGGSIRDPAAAAQAADPQLANKPGEAGYL